MMRPILLCVSTRVITALTLLPGNHQVPWLAASKSGTWRGMAGASQANGTSGLPTPWPACVDKSLSEDILAKAQLLTNAKRTCAEVEPFAVSGTKEAYEIQSAIADSATVFQRGMMSRVFVHTGWRVGAASPEASARMGLSEPYRGPLFSGYEKKSNSKLRWEEQGAALIDVGAGLAFRTSHTILPRSQPYTMEEVWSCLSAVVPVIHISASRVPDALPPSPQTSSLCIADWGLLGTLILGRDVPTEGMGHGSLPHVEVSIAAKGASANQTCAHTFGGGPLATVTWLVNSLGKDGIPILAGQILSSGSAAILTPDQIGWGDTCTVEATFEKLEEGTCTVKVMMIEE